MVSTFKVVLTDTAWVDLNKIAEDIAEVSLSYRSVDKWVKKILNGTKTLSVFAEGGPKFLFDNKYRTKKVGKYIIIYKVSKDKQKVYVMRILFARRDLSKVKLIKHTF